MALDELAERGLVAMADPPQQQVVGIGGRRKAGIGLMPAGPSWPSRSVMTGALVIRASAAAATSDTTILPSGRWWRAGHGAT